jgi:protein TonB
VHFVAPEWLQTKTQDPGIEIVLINSKTERIPTKAEVLAQANFDGGGDKDKGRATSPLPNVGYTQEGDSLSEARKKIENFEAEQKALMSLLKEVRQRSGEQVADKPTLTANDMMDSATQMAREAAIIESRIEEENRRPKKHHFGTSARDSAAAMYVDNFRQRVEKWGNEHYPEAAKGRVYGTVQITVVLDKSGQIYSLELNRSSGHAVLDQAALNIVRRAGPYGRFSSEMGRQMDLLSITRTMIFTNDALETRTSR